MAPNDENLTTTLRAVAKAILSASPDDQAAAGDQGTPEIGQVLPEGQAPQGTPAAEAPGPPAAALSHDDLKRMTPEQINERWDEVQKALAAGGGS